MTGLAAVPLYRRFCQATGYGGTVQRRGMGMPWKFIPTQREVSVKPGESALAFYTAENLSSAPITGMSTYNVTPMKVII
ncbi:putative cytochrome c oxidase assembly protein CtaG/Cox11 [Helianthus annuus]|nr:putative cytochrome c oxidase assembly protein CtaG/Cox11 [Helianthus annuus]